MDKEFKDSVVAEMLKRQAEIQILPPSIDDIEPFSWMDPEMKAHLEQGLSQDEMAALDQIARQNIVGQRIMSRGMTNAIRAAMSKDVPAPPENHNERN